MFAIVRAPAWSQSFVLLSSRISRHGVARLRMLARWRHLRGHHPRPYGGSPASHVNVRLTSSGLGIETLAIQAIRFQFFKN